MNMLYVSTVVYVPFQNFQVSRTWGEAEGLHPAGSTQMEDIQVRTLLYGLVE